MLFFLWAQTTGKRLCDCGSISIYTKSYLFPKVHLLDSIKKWQSTYFYVRNLTETDRIGLPAFSNAMPTARSWGRKVPVDEVLEESMMAG